MNRTLIVGVGTVGLGLAIGSRDAAMQSFGFSMLASLLVGGFLQIVTKNEADQAFKGDIE